MEYKSAVFVFNDNLPGFTVKYRIRPERIQLIDASDRLREVRHYRTEGTSV